MFELDGVACQGLPFFIRTPSASLKAPPRFSGTSAGTRGGEAEAGTQGMNRDLFEGASARKFSREEALRLIHDAVQPVAASFGLEVWGIELAGAGRPVVRIFVDAPASALPSEACSPERMMLPAFRAAWGWSSVRKFPAWWVWLWTWKMFFPTPGRWKFPLPVWTDLFQGFPASSLCRAGA